MDITPLIASTRQLIQSYGNGGFKISGESYDGSVMVFPDITIPWEVDPVALFSEKNFHTILETIGKVELLLVGCGASMKLVPPALRAAFKQRGIAIEAMDTGAACRTYNVLLSEERRVAAALLAT